MDKTFDEWWAAVGCEMAGDMRREIDMCQAAWAAATERAAGVAERHAEWARRQVEAGRGESYGGEAAAGKDIAAAIREGK